MKGEGQRRKKISNLLAAELEATISSSFAFLVEAIVSSRSSILFCEEAKSF